MSKELVLEELEKAIKYVKEDLGKKHIKYKNIKVDYLGAPNFGAKLKIYFIQFSYIECGIQYSYRSEINGSKIKFDCFQSILSFIKAIEKGRTPDIKQKLRKKVA